MCGQYSWAAKQPGEAAGAQLSARMRQATPVARALPGSVSPRHGRIRERQAAGGLSLGCRHGTLVPHLQRPDAPRCPPAARPSSPQTRRQGSNPPVAAPTEAHEPAPHPQDRQHPPPMWRPLPTGRAGKAPFSRRPPPRAPRPPRISPSPMPNSPAQSPPKSHRGQPSPKAASHYASRYWCPATVSYTALSNTGHCAVKHQAGTMRGEDGIMTELLTPDQRVQIEAHRTQLHKTQPTTVPALEDLLYQPIQVLVDAECCTGQEGWGAVVMSRQCGPA